MKSDAKARRIRVIARLEKQLKQGYVIVSNKFMSLLSDENYKNFMDSQKPEHRKAPIRNLTDKDRERIVEQIEVLKTRI